MGSDKLFLEVGGLPVVGHSWKRFDAHPDIDGVVLVIRPDNRALFEGLASRLSLTRPYTLIVGGAERQDSLERVEAVLRKSKSSPSTTAHDLASMSKPSRIHSMQPAKRRCRSGVAGSGHVEAC